MKLLITGAAGFIGFHAVERFLQEGFDVVGIDSINDYYDPALKYGRLSSAGIAEGSIAYNKEVQSSKHEKYRFFKMLLEDDEAMNTLFDLEKFDIVINLAAQAGVRYSLENPQAYIKSNITGFINILECCRSNDVKHLVYASSSSVYGLNSDPIFSTDHNVDHPVSVYAATKRSNELMAHVYSHLYRLPTTGLRFFTVYGPWGRPDMAPMLFTKAILEDNPISIFNHGNMMRDFTYIDDIVEGIYRVSQKFPSDENGFKEKPSPSNSTAPFTVYNIGNNQPIRLMDFIEILEKELGKKAVRKYMDMQPGDVVSTYADVTPLVYDTGYKPSTKLETGIGKFVEWYKSFYL